MTLNEIKIRMLEYKDFYGSDIPDRQAIKKAKSKKKLKAIIEQHRHLMEDTLADAMKDLDEFKKEIGLSF